MLTQFFLRFVLKCSGQARCPLWYQFFLNLQRELRIPEPFQGSEALKCPCPYLAAGTCSPVSSIRTYLFFLFLYCHLGGAKFRFKSNPIPTSDPLRAQIKPCAQQGLETPQRLSQNCVWVSPVEGLGVSNGPPQGQGLWVHEPWSPSLWHKPSWRRSPLTPTIEPSSRWTTKCRTIVPKKFSHC